MSEDIAIYGNQGINFSSLKHLSEIGLITHGGIAGYSLKLLQKKAIVFYYGSSVLIEFQNEKDNQLSLGKALLSKAGQELAEICGSKPCEGFKDYIVGKWKTMGLIVTTENIPKDL